MLFRAIRGYAPANLIPAIVSFVAIYAFTRLVPPSEYGAYALVVSVVLMCQAIFFYWLQVGAARFIARAEQDATLPQLTSTIYRGFAICALAFTIGYALTLLLAPFEAGTRAVLWLGLPLILARALVAINQAFHRAAQRVTRYNIVECGQALLGLTIGLLLVSVGGLKANGILLGLAAGSWLVALIDLAFVTRAISRQIDRAQLSSLLAFGLPLTVAYALNFILSASDRMLVEYYLGSAAVGIYAVSYGVMERALTSIFLIVSLAAFPLAIMRYEQEGVPAAQDQMYLNGTALLGLAVPACIGLILVKDHLAAVLIGPAFRDQAALIMPWIALSTLLAGMQVHYFDHAFHLGRRTGLFLWSAGPAALINIGLNIMLLPRIGLMGAVYATVISYAFALAGSIFFGRKAFAIRFPFKPLTLIVLANIPMVAVLMTVSFPKTPWGLAAMIATGGICYAVAAFALDIGSVRAKIRQRFIKKGAANG